MTRRPRRRVAGGTSPAAIWHEYMKVAKKGCGDFAKPKEPFQAKPFNGKYQTGAPERKDQPQGTRRPTRRRTRTRSRAATATAAAGQRRRRTAGRRAAGAAAAAAQPQPAQPATPQPPAAGPRAGRRAGRPGAVRRARLIPRSAATLSSLSKEEKVEFEGEVVEALPNAMFRVKLDNDHMVLGHVAGKMRRHRIRILPGDRVRVELSPYDLDRARVIYRYR